MDKRFAYTVLPCLLSMFFSCKNMQSENRGPIVLGDSSTIVTENDPSRLQDLVTDLQPEIKPSAEAKDTTPVTKAQEAPHQDTAKKSQLPSLLKMPAPVNAISGTGLKADFNIMSVLIPDVNAKQAGNRNLAHANDAVYTFVSGTVNGNVIKTTANVSKVSQRYQTIIVVKNDLGVLPLESLSTTTPWAPLKGADNTYKITGLDERSLKYADADRSDIRDAVARAARRHHMSKRKQQEWERSVRNARAANQRPLNVILRSVMWKIDGKDANGKAFSKQIRLDMPI